MNTGRSLVGSTGGSPYTSALVFGGSPASGGEYSAAESWGGSSWTSITAMNDARSYIEGVGSSNTSALAFGGYDGSSYITKTETWNGSSWTEVNDMTRPNGRGDMQGVGTSTAALSAGGSPPNVALTEDWNGTSWTEVADVPTGISGAGGIGSTSEAFVANGRQGPSSAISVNAYEWGAPTTSTVTFTAS